MNELKQIFIKPSLANLASKSVELRQVVKHDSRASPWIPYSLDSLHVLD